MTISPREMMLFGVATLAPLAACLESACGVHLGAQTNAWSIDLSSNDGALHLRDYNDDKQVLLGFGDLSLAEIVATSWQGKWNGWPLSEEDSDCKQKLGLEAIQPAYATVREAVRS